MRGRCGARRLGCGKRICRKEAGGVGRRSSGLWLVVALDFAASRAKFWARTRPVVRVGRSVQTRSPRHARMLVVRAHPRRSGGTVEDAEVG